MTTITGKLISPIGTAINTAIKIQLQPGTQNDAANNQISSAEISITPVLGVWTVDLEPTDDMGCSDAHYIFTFPDGTRYFKDVPTAASKDFDELEDHY